MGKRIFQLTTCCDSGLNYRLERKYWIKNSPREVYQKLRMLLLIFFLYLNLLTASALLMAQEVDKRLDELDLPKMVLVEGGEFVMGKADSFFRYEIPHNVKLTEYYIAETEVTYAQYAAFLNNVDKDLLIRWGNTWINLEEHAGKNRPKIQRRKEKFFVEEGYENYPVEYVSWYGAQAFCDWLSNIAKLDFRLPTDAEWEFAASAGIYGYDNDGNPKYGWAGTDNKDSLLMYAWLKENSNSTTHPVKNKRSNDLGIYDMTGNVFEWVEDAFDTDFFQKCFNQGVVENPVNKEFKRERVIRGFSITDGVDFCPLTFRIAAPPFGKIPYLGFRVAYSVYN